MFDFVFMDNPPPSPSPIAHEFVLPSQNDIQWNTPLKYIAALHCLNFTKEQLDEDWKLNDFFGTIAVINLPKAKKRLKKVTKELKKIGVTNFEIFPAINGREDLDASIWQKFHANRDSIDSSSKKGQLELDRLHQGEAGCYMSHYTLIKKIKESFDKAMQNYVKAFLINNEIKVREAKQRLRKYSRVLIFEDDAAFGIVNERRTKSTKKYAGRLLRKAMKTLPDTWDILYLVVQATEPTTKKAPYLRKMNRSYCALAYAVNYTMYDTLIHQLKKIENPLVTSVEPLDCEISSIHHKHKVYAIAPSIVYHQLGPSQISAKSRSKLWQGQPICLKKHKKK